MKGNISSVRDWSLSVQVFIYLQVLDLVTTALGFRAGLGEASPFIRVLMHAGPIQGVVLSKLGALALGAFCVWRRRFNVIHLINYWYAALVLWNLALIITH